MTDMNAWIVTNKRGQDLATCKHMEDAILLCGRYGRGASISYSMEGRRLRVWREGGEEYSASSEPHAYGVALIIEERLASHDIAV